MSENLSQVGPQWESRSIKEGVSLHSLRTSVGQIGLPEERQANLHNLAKKSFKYPYQEEREDDYGYSDYAFTFHCTDLAAKATGIEANKQGFSDEEIRSMCANNNVLKIVLNNGWTATREMWELDRQNIVNGLVERFEQMGIPVVIINFDSNGWGDSKVTPEAADTLKLGPVGALFKGKVVDEEGLKKKWMESRGDHATNALQPASVKRAANALHIALNDSLHVKGNLLMIGHSQGGKITRQYIHDEEERMTDSNYKSENSKNILGYGLAAAESIYDLDESMKSVFSVLKMLQVLPGEKIQAKALLSGAEAVTSIFGIDSKLPKEIRRALLAIHKGQMTRDNLPMVIDQAFGWARKVYADNPDEAVPQNMIYLAGRNDKLIPLDGFSAWNSDRVASRMGDMARIFSWSRPAAQEYEGSHYFFFDERYADGILDQVAQTSRDIFFDEKAREVAHTLRKMDEEMMTKPYGRLRFAMTTKSDLTKKPLQERIDAGLELVREDVKAQSARSDVARIVPVTFEEMTILYQNIMSLPNAKTKYILGSHLGNAWGRVMESWDSANMLRQERSGKQITTDTMIEARDSIKNLVELFPFDLYRQEGVSPEQMPMLIEKWIGPRIKPLETLVLKAGVTVLPTGATDQMVIAMTDFYRQLI